MSVQQITVNVDGYLALNKYEVDEANAHIELVEDPSDEEFDKLVMVCPAALYKREPDGTTSFDYAGCLECGTCRIACGDTIIARWENPQPTMGAVSYTHLDVYKRQLPCCARCILLGRSPGFFG